jgi:hypothetical protein
MAAIGLAAQKPQGLTVAHLRLSAFWKKRLKADNQYSRVLSILAM